MSRAFLGSVFLIAALAPLPAVAAKTTTTSICKYDSRKQTWTLTSVSTSSVSQLLATGSVLPGAYRPDADKDTYGAASASPLVCPRVGYVGVGGDCDDTRATVNPGRTEVAYNGTDDDCATATRDDDLDADGYVLSLDCDDTRATVNPGHTEVAYNGVDDDCAPATPDDDLDGDGFVRALDCDDGDAGVNPGTPEIPYDGLDDDCDAATPDDDLDGDGFVRALDCDDGNVGVNPGTAETPYNGVDDDCSAATPDDDLDGDGYARASDCDDTTAAVNPGRTEVPYNGVDDDCTASTRDDDLDGDGVLVASDCNDRSASVRPGATEVCHDAIDQDCDGQIDEGCDHTCSCAELSPSTMASTYATYVSKAGAEPSTKTCTVTDMPGSVRTVRVKWRGTWASKVVSGYTNLWDRQYDTSGTPYAGEGAPRWGNSCAYASSSRVDGAWFATSLQTSKSINQLDHAACQRNLLEFADAQGFACTYVDGDVDDDGYASTVDCVDTNPAVHPGATEVPYNGLDDDCAASTRDDDVDGDGFGIAADCDDTDATVSPADPEVPYNGVDDDCAVATPDDDLDGDGWGWLDDCDDLAAAAFPGGLEVPYDGLDNDCDPVTPDDDLDGDGYASATDCDDDRASAHPGAAEVCGNGVDDDCDLRADEGCGACPCFSATELERDYQTWRTLRVGAASVTDSCQIADPVSDLPLGPYFYQDAAAIEYVARNADGSRGIDVTYVAMAEPTGEHTAKWWCLYDGTVWGTVWDTGGPDFSIRRYRPSITEIELEACDGIVRAWQDRHALECPLTPVL